MAPLASVVGKRIAVVLFTPRFRGEAKTHNKGNYAHAWQLGAGGSAEMNALVRYPFTCEHATLVEPGC
jgi:hypothetical protein